MGFGVVMCYTGTLCERDMGDLYFICNFKFFNTKFKPEFTYINSCKSRIITGILRFPDIVTTYFYTFILQ